MMNIPNSSDVLLYKNMPYGFWKSGHPFVKYCCVFIGLVGMISKSPSLILQSSALCLILLYMPTSKRSKIINIFWNFGVGSGIIYFLSPAYIDKLPKKISSLQYVGNLNWKMLFSYLVLIFVLFNVRKAFTSRDFSWFIDTMPNKVKPMLSSTIYSYMFGMIKGPATIRELSTAIKSRGGCRFFRRKKCRNFEAYIDLIGIWVMNLLRKVEDMALSVEYILISRIKIFERSNPAKWAWSEVDYSIVGIIISIVIVKRILPYLKELFQMINI